MISVFAAGTTCQAASAYISVEHKFQTHFDIWLGQHHMRVLLVAACVEGHTLSDGGRPWGGWGNCQKAGGVVTTMMEVYTYGRQQCAAISSRVVFNTAACHPVTCHSRSISAQRADAEDVGKKLTYVDSLCQGHKTASRMTADPCAVALCPSDPCALTPLCILQATAADQKAYMCELYSRCMETKKKTEAGLAQKYLQPIGVNRRFPANK